MICKCGSELPDGFYLCATCGESLAYALAEVDAVVEVLDAGVARTSLTAGYGERVSSSGPLHAPLPINEAVFDARHALHTWLMKTSVKLAWVIGQITDRSSQGLASYLLRNLDALRRQDWAPTLEAELRKLLNTAIRTERQFAGTCQTPDCGTELYAIKGEDHTTCRTCGTHYEQIQEWRTQATNYARNQEHDIIGYPNALSQRLNRVHGETITPEHIRLLASRGLLVRANPERNEAGKVLRPMYRLGDVAALVKAA
jgi:DNA-directed RNA polymerase subunit RPC12/RpoP